MLDIKDQIELEIQPHGEGISAQDLLQMHINAMYGQVTEVQMYTDGTLNPPPLQSDTDIGYTVV